ncbi:uncharacterized protein LOC109835390 isoform X3 [Asparagus officinalis]|uniref:uncharacterized protein LOC109835390 isoform X3 n=1 Tax=Asparagus officinalis TaxID=4686 RepID=UPI00098DE692|nr:uncharacterized protein LOC109835390 isoform X3 [Asparagus officinalis]
MKMAWNKLMFVFILVAASPLNPQEAVGDLLSPLSPLLSPVLSSINYSCTNVSVSPAPAASPTNLSLFDPCKWAYCGGGKCSQISTYEHKCVCNEGYSNIFNASAFPCYKDCSLGADCTNLGINLFNSTSMSPRPNASDDQFSAGDYSALKNSICLLTLIISLTTYRLM